MRWYWVTILELCSLAHALAEPDGQAGQPILARFVLDASTASTGSDHASSLIVLIFATYFDTSGDLEGPFRWRKEASKQAVLSRVLPNMDQALTECA